MSAQSLCQISNSSMDSALATLPSGAGEEGAGWCLPFDVQAVLFRHLPPPDVLEARQVCRQWRDAADAITGGLRPCGSDMVQALPRLAARYTALRWLELAAYSADVELHRVLTQLPRLPLLHGLKLEGRWVPTREVAASSSDGASRPSCSTSLRQLALLHCGALSADDVAACVRAAPHLACLTLLRCSGLTGEAALGVAAAAAPVLRELTVVQSSPLGDRWYNVAPLAALTRLRRVVLCPPPPLLGELSLPLEQVRQLSALPALTELDISGFAGAERLLLSLAEAQAQRSAVVALRRLHLDGARNLDEQALEDLLFQCSALHALSLAPCPRAWARQGAPPSRPGGQAGGDPGRNAEEEEGGERTPGGGRVAWGALARAGVGRLTRLRQLDLKGVMLTAPGCAALLQPLSGLRSLSWQPPYSAGALSAGVLALVALHLTRLTRLHFSAITWPRGASAACAELSALMSALTGLRDLGLAHGRGLPPRALSALSQLNGLRRLDLRGAFEAGQMGEALTHVAACAGLRTLLVWPHDNWQWGAAAAGEQPGGDDRNYNEGEGQQGPALPHTGGVAVRGMAALSALTGLRELQLQRCHVLSRGVPLSRRDVTEERVAPPAREGGATAGEEKVLEQALLGCAELRVLIVGEAVAERLRGRLRWACWAVPWRRWLEHWQPAGDVMGHIEDTLP